MKLTKTGYVIIGPTGQVLLDGFDAEGVSCRELAYEAMKWAREQLHRPINYDEAFLAGEPCDQADDVCAIDFVPELQAALEQDDWLNR